MWCGRASTRCRPATPGAGCRCGSAARTVEVLDGPRWSPATNARSARYVEVLILDHYLEVLKIKPGALPGATALAQAKATRRVHRLAPGATGTRPAAPAATRPAPAP